MTLTRFVMLIAGFGALVVAALLLLGGSGSASDVLEQPASSLRPLPEPAFDGSARSLKHPTLSSHLILLADAAERAAVAGTSLSADSSALPAPLSAMVSANQMRLSDDGLVQVYVEIDGAHDVAGALVAAGADVERVEDALGIIQAWLPAIDLPSIALLPGVLRVRLPEYPHLNAGSVTTEGDAVLNADDVRSTFGVDGSGFSVGVISDGVGGLAAAQALGDLPAVDTTTCNVVAPADPGASGAEGTAMLEIVHDIAPGAALMFGNFGFATSLDFNNAVDCLAANNDVVVDDIGFFGAGPYDGTSFISQNTADALNGAGPIRGYFTSVGNQANEHYQGDYVDSTVDYTNPVATWSLHQFDTGGPLGTKHAGQLLAPSSLNTFLLPAGESATMSVVWDDPWENSPNDYDLYVFDIFGGVECVGGNFQGGPGTWPPVEFCGVTNASASDAFYDIAIGNFNDTAAAVEFDMFLNCRSCADLGNGNILDFNTPGSSVPNQGDSSGSPVSVISLGAVYHDEPGNDDVEFFSSIGPTNDGRMKPDVSAPDGVSITGSGGFGSNCGGNPCFFGTSAAAPHAAGVAALLLDCNGSLGRQALRDAILNNATDIESPGPDQLSGAGHIDALASANAVTCGAPTPTATNTSTGATNTPTSTPVGPTPTATPTDPPPTCPVDLHEENDTDTTPAFLFPPVNQSGLSVCEDDRDWYSFDLALGEEVYIESLFLHSEGDIDLVLFGPDGLAVADSLTFDDDELILYYAEASGKHLLLVDLFADQGTLPGNLYILTVTVTEPIVYGDASCNGDVNAIDAAIVLQFTALLINSLGCEEAADANLDGVADAIDAALILQFIAGLIANLPV